MDNHGLSLHYFGHIFEVFACYYLLLGTNRSFHNYFNLSTLFKRWPSTYEEKKAKILHIDNLLKNRKDSIPIEDSEGFWKILKKIFQYLKHRRGANQNVSELNKILPFLNFHLESHFDLKCGEGEDKEKEGESDFHKFITPYYVYYGTLSVSLLVFCGIFDKWKMLSNLSMVNLITLTITIILAIQLFRNRKYYKSFKLFDPLKIFVISIFGLFAFIIIPSSWVKKICFIPYPIPSNVISFNDLQILGITALILLPVVLHLIILYRIVNKHKRMETLISRLSTGIELFKNLPQQVFPDTIPRLNGD